MMVLIGLLSLLILNVFGDQNKAAPTPTQPVAIVMSSTPTDVVPATPTAQPTATAAPPPTARMASVPDIEQILPSNVELALSSSLSLNPNLSQTYTLEQLVSLLRSLGVNGLADATIQAGQQNGYIAQISRVWDTCLYVQILRKSSFRSLLCCS